MYIYMYIVMVWQFFIYSLMVVLSLAEKVQLLYLQRYWQSPVSQSRYGMCKLAHQRSIGIHVHVYTLCT